MAREINMDTMRQNFWAESIKKETQLRRSWLDILYIIYYHMIYSKKTTVCDIDNMILHRKITVQKNIFRYSEHQSKGQASKKIEDSNLILQRRASKLRSFVPTPVDRKIEGYEDKETDIKLPELVSLAIKF